MCVAVRHCCIQEPALQGRAERCLHGNTGTSPWGNSLLERRWSLIDVDRWQQWVSRHVREYATRHGANMWKKLVTTVNQHLIKPFPSEHQLHQIKIILRAVFRNAPPKTLSFIWYMVCGPLWQQLNGNKISYKISSSLADSRWDWDHSSAEKGLRETCHLFCLWWYHLVSHNHRSPLFSAGFRLTFS